MGPCSPKKEVDIWWIDLSFKCKILDISCLTPRFVDWRYLKVTINDVVYMYRTSKPTVPLTPIYPTRTFDKWLSTFQCVLSNFLSNYQVTSSWSWPRNAFQVEKFSTVTKLKLKKKTSWHSFLLKMACLKALKCSEMYQSYQKLHFFHFQKMFEVSIVK
jgi:hypothetical protein